MTSLTEIDTVLIANRGEIAVRIIRTLKSLGIRSIAVYSDADAGALHVREADEAVRVGPAAAAESYLNIERVIDAARRTGARAIHPGFGFLAENAAFARACAEAGIVFIGPSPEAIDVMGDKISARAAVEARGVATVPGLARPGLSDDELFAGAAAVGYPLLIKPSAGGGGKGMHVVTDAAELRPALAAARREAAASFGDDALFIERYVASPRHIEVQIVADTHGNTVHLGERECSLQRRHQKVIEEAPSPLLESSPDGAEIRARLGEAACETARSVGYIGAGTVEFIVSADRPDEFFFMEMNTRLQVEHPVTEQVTGIDLVELQLRIAAGEPLPFSQPDVHLTGHSIEARVYAEAPQAGFLPTGGRAVLVQHPRGDGIRVDTSLADGLEISTDYDPMLAKVIAWGADRGAALRRLDAALAHTVVLGFDTNVEFLRLLLRQPRVALGTLDTDLIAREFDELRFAQPSARLFAEAALISDRAASTTSHGWGRGDGWRLGPPAARIYRFINGDRTAEVQVRGPEGSLRVCVDDGPERDAALTVTGANRAVATVGALTREVVHAVATDGLWLATDGVTTRIAEQVARAASSAGADASPQLLSPLPGTVVLVAASDGTEVEVGDAVVVVEAMKMEHVLRASVAGTVRIALSVGDRVARGAVVATVTPA